MAGARRSSWSSTASRRPGLRCREACAAEMEFEDEPELEGFAAPPAPCRPLRWPERAYLEAELAELDGFAPPVPRRPLRWLAPERAYFEVGICWVLCVCAQWHSPSSS